MRAALPLCLLLPITACEERPEGRNDAWVAVSEDTHDFGEIPHGESREHRFWVENRSSQRIRLTGIRSQCSCAVVEPRVLAGGVTVDDRPMHNPPKFVQGGYLMTWLEPGERLELTVRIDTKLRPPVDHVEPSLSELHFEPQEVGKILFTYRFKIRARVWLFGELATKLTPVIDLGQYSKYQEVFSVFEVAPRDGNDFRVLGIEGTDDRLILERRKAKHAGGYRWLVRLRPNGLPGPFERQLKFKTDLPGNYELPIAVSGNAVPSLQIFPFARLDFNRIDFTKPQRIFVTLMYRRPQLDPVFRIGKIEVMSGGGEDIARFFEAGIEGGEVRRWTLWLNYKGGFQGNRFKGWVQLVSADPEHESTVIPFSGFRR